MSETIGEMILPGTYIEVRAEGLIGVSGISTGNIGIVGSANRGPIGEVRVLGSYSEALDTFGSYDRWPDDPSSTDHLTLNRALEQVFKGGGSSIYAVRVANGTVDTMSWEIQDSTDAPLFTLEATSPGTWANDIDVSLEAPASQPVKVTLVYGRTKEVFTGTTAKTLFNALKSSKLVGVKDLDSGDEAKVPAQVVAGTAPSGDGEGLTSTEIEEGLALLATQPVNIVTVAGFSAKDIASSVLAHLEATENDGMERMAVLGASSDDTDDIIADDVSAGSNPRLVLVAPGIKAADAARSGESNTQVDLTAPYAAALVAGRLATLAPHVSLTNKDVAAAGLTTEYTRAQQKLLLTNQVLVLAKNLGIRVLKGITTDTGAFRQISVRRIVDYAKAGVRIGANPYIGRLNNVRVRTAMKATLDGFLSSMVLDEMLVGYTLDVSATRAQEIAGQAIVTMTLQPTFSIDFVKVIMNLE